jgi:hypothetical protein
MTAEERRHIVQMVASGKITADQAAALMRELDAAPERGTRLEKKVSRGEPPSGIERLRGKARALAAIPLWTGVTLVVVAALGMFYVQQNAGYTLWFFCLWVPLFAGVGLMMLGSTTTRWLYLNVDRSRRKDGQRGTRFALPVPLGMAGWFLSTFGKYIKGLKQTAVDEVIQALAKLRGVNEPVIVDVDEEDGEHVQIYLG